MARAKSAFQRLVNANSISALEAEIAEDKVRFSQLFSRYGQMREELQALTDSIARQEGVLDALRNALPGNGREAPADSEPGTKASLTNREMAEEVLRESLQPLFPREVRDAAIQRGWLDDGHAAGNQLSVAMAKAARAGILDKDDKGRYTLPEHH